MEPQQKTWDRNAASGETHRWVPHRLTSEAHWSGAANEEGLAWARKNSKSSLGGWGLLKSEPVARASASLTVLWSWNPYQ